MNEIIDDNEVADLLFDDDAAMEPDTRKWIPDQVAVAVYRRHKGYASSRGANEQSAADYAAWAVSKAIEGRAPNPKWLYCDYMREIVGRSESPNNKTRLAIHAPIPFETPISEQNPATFFDVLVGKDGRENDWHDLFLSAPMQRALQVKDACLVVAVHVYGCTLKECGDALGVTESRISQRLKKAVRTMNDVLNGRIRALTEDGVTAGKIAEICNVEGFTSSRGTPITPALVQSIRGQLGCGTRKKKEPAPTVVAAAPTPAGEDGLVRMILFSEQLSDGKKVEMMKAYFKEQE